MEFPLFFSCSCSDSSLCRLSLSLTLTLSHITIWCSGHMALFLFFLGKAALAYLPTALFPFRQAQYAQAFPLKPAPFCTLCAGLSSTNKSAISLLLSYYLTLALSSPPGPLLHLSFYLYFSVRSSRNCLLSPPVLSGYNWSPDTRCFRGTTRLMNWPDEKHYSCPLQSLVVSLLLSLASTLIFSRTEDVLSHRSSLTHRFPRFSLWNLCSLVTSLCSLLSTLQRTQLTVKLLSL